MAKERLDYIDMVKGIGIILVVVGHSTYVADGVLTWLASFHMPLFFLVSGLLFAYKGSEAEPFGSYVKKRFFGMMIPYFWFSLIYIGVDYYYLYAHPEIMTIDFIHNAMMQSITLFGISVLWFLPTIFFGELLFYGLVKKCPLWVCILVGMVSALAGKYGKLWLDKSIKPDTDLALALLWYFLQAVLRIFPAVVFLLIGFLVSRVLKYVRLKAVSEVLIGAGLMIFHAAVAFSNGRVDMHFLEFHNLVLYYLGACSATIGLILICRHIRPFWLVNFLGSNSLIVMLTHLDCQLMSTAIRFAAGMNKYIVHAKEYMFRFHLYGSLLVGELVLIFLINRYFFFLIGRRKPVKMEWPKWIQKYIIRKIRERNLKRIK